MSTFQQIQTDFQDYLSGKAGAQAAIAACVNEQFGLSASLRLAIYRNAHHKRMRAALSAAFEQTESYMGDKMFGELADGYLVAHPSQHPNLRWFGDRFAHFATEALPDYPFIGELAALEWALGIAFDAADAESIRVADLLDVPPDAWGDLAFALHPAVQILTLKSNAGALWQALNDEKVAPDGACLATPASWLVWRIDHEAQLRSLCAFEAQALRALAEGATFGALCAAAAGMDPSPLAEKVALTRSMACYVQDWLAQGLLRLPSESR